MATRVLTVYAHPDDESFGPAAVLANWADAGAELHGVWFTRGEQGQVFAEPRPAPGQIAAWREQDLREAAQLIGYRGVEIMDYADGSLSPGAIEEHVLARLRTLQPDVVLTFGPAGITRHPDHIAVHRAAVAAFERAALPAASLYYDAVGPEAAARLGLEMELDGQPNTFIDVGRFAALKRQALALHARHVVDAAARLRELERNPLLREPLYAVTPRPRTRLVGGGPGGCRG